MSDTENNIYRCLVITEDEHTYEILKLKMEPRNYHISNIASIEHINQFTTLNAFNTIFIDMASTSNRDVNFLQNIKKNLPLTEIIVIVNSDSMDIAAKCLRLGALDFITKPINLDYLESVLETTTKKLLISRQQLANQHIVETKIIRFPRIIHESPLMKELMSKADRISQANSAVLILGESGTGKELIARTIHQKSHRCQNPFCAINCSSFTSTLLESELFGHEKGAFTGADTLQRGLFEFSDGGTIFMDEIGDMPLEAQSKLLRILESGEFRRVGGNLNLYTDVRIIAATNQNLETLVKSNKFRQDLYYRINTIILNLPALRERKGDIKILAEYFLKIIGQEIGKRCLLSDEVLHILESYYWPGNVRQLRNTIESLLLLTDSETIQVADLPAWLFGSRNLPQNEDILSLEELEKQHILKTLRKTQGNKREAARLLDIDESTLYRKLKDYGITESSLNLSAPPSNQVF